MTVKSQPQSPVKQHSRGPATGTDLRKRRGRSSTEGLPPSSPSKRSRLRSLDNSVEASPELPTTNLSQSLRSADIFMEPPPVVKKLSPLMITTPSSSHIQTLDSTPTAPQASSSISQSRGGRTPTVPRGDGRKAQGSKNQGATSFSRVTHSNSPKKRRTRAHPT